MGLSGGPNNIALRTTVAVAFPSSNTKGVPSFRFSGEEGGQVGYQWASGKDDGVLMETPLPPTRWVPKNGSQGRLWVTRALGWGSLHSRVLTSHVFWTPDAVMGTGAT